MPLSRPSCLMAALALGPFAGGVSCAEDDVRLQGLLPGGARTTLTDAWGVLGTELVNPGPTDREVRVMILFPDQPAVQFGRDVRIPARSTMKTWVPVRPPPGTAAESVEIQSLLYDHTGGQNRLVVPPGDDGKVRSRRRTTCRTHSAETAYLRASWAKVRPAS